jgi:hypothetical protein
MLITVIQLTGLLVAAVRAGLDVCELVTRSRRAARDHHRPGGTR